MNTETRPPLWLTLLAFATIYLVWGSTFFAIRVGVREVPPFLLASIRFLLAGLILCGWTLLRRESLPSPREWLSSIAVAIPLFLFDYGAVFWAEKRVPSGITAVIMATIPVFTALAEILFLRTQALTLRLAASLAVGLAGVAALISDSLHLGGPPVDRAGALALIFGSVSWAGGSILMRKLPMPASKTASSGSQMLVGGTLLGLASIAFRETAGFHPAAVSRGAWLALAYLVLAGSVAAFTAYVWLMHHESPTRVATYAYVNPVVAILIGWALGGEPLNARTIVGSVLVLLSLLLIMTRNATPRAAKARAVKVR